MLAAGAHSWENQLVERLWTYSIDAVWDGIRTGHAQLASVVQEW
ncbi:MAG: hypothetical protein ACRYF3_03365 [Janthinobacterium lividum]